MNRQEEEIANITKIILLKSIQYIVYLNMNEKRAHLNYLKKEKKIDLMSPCREMTQFKMKIEFN